MLTEQMIQELREAYKTVKTINPNSLSKFHAFYNKLDTDELIRLTKEKIPFISSLAHNAIYRRTGSYEL